MSGLMKSLSSLPVFNVMNRASYGLPALPENLGLPEQPQGNRVGQGLFQGRNQKADSMRPAEIEKVLTEQRTKAETYNKAFADLLNQQPQLSGGERVEIYNAYSSKMMDQAGKRIAPLTDYSSTLSQAGAMTREQIAAQQQQQQQQQAAPAPTPMPTPAPAPAPVAQAPQTVGPVAQPMQMAPTPTVATNTGNIAGKTTTTGVLGTDAGGRGSRGKRGRVATLLTGLGGTVEQFGS